MVGSAVTGAMSMAIDVSVRAPHGGIFVLFAVGNVVGYIIALAAGVAVGAVAVVVREVDRHVRRGRRHRVTRCTRLQPQP